MGRTHRSSKIEHISHGRDARVTGARRRVCFVTGTRAEFGLMRTTLEAIKAHPSLQLQLIVTGMHLSPAHGNTFRQIQNDGWRIDAKVPWPMTRDPGDATGLAMAGIARALKKLRSDVVLVVGDRVEAFAAAAAGHLSGCVVAHVHGGDRAMGQVDDALRHAITKLAHAHFPATRQSAARIKRLGEDSWRIVQAGAPGIDGIIEQADPHRLRNDFALVILHPTDDDEAAEFRRADMLIRAVRSSGVDRIIIIQPNNDPGWRGIARAWKRLSDDPEITVLADVPRAKFLGLLRDCHFLIGNSSSGIIEAASFATRVIDVGPRQRGRERSANVTHVNFNHRELQTAIAKILRGGSKKRGGLRNVYGGRGTGRKIADVLGRIVIDDRLRRKLISY